MTTPGGGQGSYTTSTQPPGGMGVTSLGYGQEGYALADDQAIGDLSAWVREGKLKVEEDVIGRTRAALEEAGALRRPAPQLAAPSGQEARVVGP